MVRSGLRVLDAMLEEDRTALCGPRYAHTAVRHASRAGTVPSEVVLGGRKVGIQRPRVRAGGREVPLPTVQTLAQTDPLNRRVVEQMLVGVATRQYARSLEPLKGRGGEPRHEQEQCQPPVRGEDDGAVAVRGNRRRWTASTSWRCCSTACSNRGALPRGGPRDRGGRPETRARPVGGRHRKHRRVSELAGASPEPRPAHGPQPARDPRWRAGPAQSGARGLRRGRPHSAVPSPQAPQHPRPPAGATAPVGPGDRAACLSGERREDGGRGSSRISPSAWRTIIPAPPAASEKGWTKR